MRGLQPSLSWGFGLLFVTVVGCGEEIRGDTPMSVEVVRHPLLTDSLTRACLSLYAGRQSCEVIRLSAVPGVFQSQIALAGAPEVDSTLFRVRAGTYTAAVWATDASDSAVAFGCSAEAVEVLDGDRASITIVVNTNPDPELGDPCPRR